MRKDNFRSRIRRSIANQTLQVALDNNAHRRVEGRLATLASLPDHQERRQRLHAIKADVVAHLDEYLQMFIQKVTANGINVHQAESAQQAVEIFLGIARSIGKLDETNTPLLIAKSKSMVSEEIDLNHALEAQGMRVVETDLGEYIVQLRGERPSHIITPAVHLRRNDVGKLFEEKLGLPYTEEIPVLTNTARKVLRETFLEADIGFSGVNFGVADTGTLCIVTNEGNGRMVTTLPPVHVALMGIERLVPSLDDLALFLSLLPPSATGQKITVYTSLINGPLPGQQRHLILLDNGRRLLRDSALAESLFCIRCGACLNTCPVFRELGGHAYGSIYPGPIGSVVSCGLIDPSLDALAQASSLCGACREACPVDIDLPGLLLRIRAGQTPIKNGGEGRGLPMPVKLGLRGFRLAAGNSPLFGFLQSLGGWFTHMLSPRHDYMRLPAWTGWGYSKDFPRLARKPFRAKWKGIGQTTGARAEKTTSSPPKSKEPGRVAHDLVEQFCTELVSLGGIVHRTVDRQVRKDMGDFLASRGIGQVCADDAGAFYLDGLPVVTVPDPDVRCGVTGAICGVAATGSLLLTSGVGETLTASLLPEIHLVVMKASQIVPTLSTAMELVDKKQAASVFVSGPSRTSDIEMSLTIGVHGPGELHVFLIDDSEVV